LSFLRYPRYKDSGVHWLGEVPAHWEVKRLKHNLRLLTEKTDRRDHPVALENIEGWTGRFIPTETKFEGEGVAFNAGDILFGKLRPYLAKAYRAESSGEAVGDFHVMRPRRDIDSRFAQYQFLNREFIAIVDGSTFGSKMPRASWEFVGSMKVTTPPAAEQSAIAAFLDRETEKIDELVAAQRRLIALLKEKRQAVMSHAVTRGLDPAAPLKPSGIEWLGDVPAHWDLRRIGSISTKITNGFVGPTRDIFAPQGIRYLQSMHIKGNEIRYDETNAPYFVSEDWSNEHAKSILESGDVLIVQTGDIGQVSVVPPEFAGCNCHALIIVAPLRPVVSGDWLSWVLNSDYGFHTLLSIQTGALHPHLNCGDVKDVSIPVPPSPEQQAIIEYIVGTARDFDALTAEAQRAIDLLQERRTAVISAAVTGQIDVRSARLATAEPFGAVLESSSPYS
jgi:type I restriction enzyme S subunit